MRNFSALCLFGLTGLLAACSGDEAAPSPVVTYEASPFVDGPYTVVVTAAVTCVDPNDKVTLQRDIDPTEMTVDVLRRQDGLHDILHASALLPNYSTVFKTGAVEGITLAYAVTDGVRSEGNVDYEGENTVLGGTVKVTGTILPETLALHAEDTFEADGDTCTIVSDANGVTKGYADLGLAGHYVASAEVGKYGCPSSGEIVNSVDDLKLIAVTHPDGRVDVRVDSLEFLLPPPSDEGTFNYVGPVTATDDPHQRAIFGTVTGTHGAGVLDLQVRFTAAGDGPECGGTTVISAVKQPADPLEITNDYAFQFDTTSSEGCSSPTGTYFVPRAVRERSGVVDIVTFNDERVKVLPGADGHFIVDAATLADDGYDLVLEGDITPPTITYTATYSTPAADTLPACDMSVVANGHVRYVAR